MRHEVGLIAQHHLNLSAQRVGDHRAAALVGHMDHVDARLRLEQLGAQMRQAAAAGRAVRQLARIGLGVLHQLGDGFDRQTGMDHQHIVDIDRAHDGREVLARVVGHLVVDAHVDRQ